MKNLNSKNKKLLLTGCLAIVCVVLIVAIYSQFKTKPEKDEATSKPNVASGEVTPAPDAVKPDETVEKKDEVVVQSIEPNTTQSTTVSQDSNEIVQTNAPEPVKPKPPKKPTPKGNVTNPSKPPDYKPEDTTVSKPAEPKAGEKKDGKIYVPGFGWQKETGGQGTQVGSDGDINKQVGTMD